MEDHIWYKYKWPKTVRKILEYPNEPLYTILDKATEKLGEADFILYEGVTISYRQTKEEADRIATFLIENGAKKADRVALFLPNIPQYPIVFHGILKAGATVVTCNPMYTPRELNFQLKDSGAKFVFCFDHDKFTPVCYEAIKDTNVEKVVVCRIKQYLPKIKAIIGSLLNKIPKSPYYEEDKTVFYEDIISSYNPLVSQVEINPSEDLAVILYTGGTTGVPKGVMLTHRNLYCNLIQIDEWIQLTPKEGGNPEKLKFGKEVFIGALPWYHSYGLTLTMNASILIGAKLVPIPDPRAGKYPLSIVLEAVQNRKGTVLHAVPTIYAGLINNPDITKYDLRSLVGCGAGAAALPPEVAKRFEALTGSIIFEGYGMTEACPMTHCDPTTAELRKLGTAGLPISDTDCKILDLDTGEELPAGKEGEIAIAGPQFMKGYWNRPEETKAAFKEIDGKRFFLSGDIGHFDEEGFTVITDRKKDMINVSGLKAYPREIEDILFEHRKVKLAAVVGIPRKDDPSSEFVKAYIVLKEGETATEEEIIEFCRDKLAGYKRPKEIEFREELPLTTIGKVLRRVLRDEELQKQ